MLRFQMIVPESRMGKRIHTGSEKTTPSFTGGLECVRPGLAAGAGGRGVGSATVRVAVISVSAAEGVRPSHVTEQS